MKNQSKTIKKTAVLGLLTAVTVLLAMFCTFRIGSTIKIPLKFMSVFITAYIYGPLCGGIVAALGDVINVFFSPVGQFNPFITGVEFLYGIIMGFFFFDYNGTKKAYTLRAVVCSLVLCTADLFITSFILYKMNYFNSYILAVKIRLIASAVKFVINIIYFTAVRKYLNKIRKAVSGDENEL